MAGSRQAKAEVRFHAMRNDGEKQYKIHPGKATLLPYGTAVQGAGSGCTLHHLMDLSRAYFVHSESLESLHYPPDCPFKTERAAMCRSVLAGMGCYGGVLTAPEPALEEELCRFHTSEYLRILERASASHLDHHGLFAGLGTPETPVFADLYPYATLAAGATLAAARLILDGEADIVFNPSGGFHHALEGHAGGFCYVNDIVLACHRLADAGKRVLCLDIDAHHGNGQQTAFYGSAQVLTISFHESGKTLYPWGGFVEEAGEGDGRGYNVNVPCPAGTDDEAFLLAFREVVPPLLAAFAPDAIVLEIGMDTLATDPLTHLAMTNNAVADALPVLSEAGVPILATGGGGYNPAETARGWALAWATLCGIDTENDMYIGLGGTFLGGSEAGTGLRDIQGYRSGEEKRRVVEELASVVTHIREHVFPVHGIR